MCNMKIDSLLFSKNSDTFKIYDSSGLVDIKKIRDDVAETTEKLKSINLWPHENIAVICDNHSCFLSAIMSIISAGAVPVPVDPQISFSSLEDIFKKFNIRCAFIFGKRAKKIFNNNKICNHIFHYDNSKWICPENATNNNEQQMFLDSDITPAIILLTSGTADLMHKGVLISHDSIFNNIESIIEYMQPQSTESLYIAKSMSHISSVIGELLMALTVGMTLYIYNPVVPYSVLYKRIIECKPDYLVVNPTILHYLTKYAENEKELELPSIKGIYTCGGFSSATLINKARNTFANSKVYNMYGLTEAGPRVTSQTDELDNYTAGFAGKTIKSVSVKVINEYGEARTNEEGRIFVKSNALMIGYYGDPELTRNKFQNGWLVTGDVGYLNENQELFVSGRADDVVVRSGKNINLNTVEDIISEIDEIRECIVFSIPDEVNQNKIICAYVKNSDKHLDATMVREHCLKKLFPYECPQQIVEWENIPKTNTNKKSRKKASKFYRESTT